MSATPRTDALCKKQGSRSIDHLREILELESLARELEMENAQIRADNARLREALEQLLWHVDNPEMDIDPVSVAYAEMTLDAAIQQSRAALAQTEDK